MNYDSWHALKDDEKIDLLREEVMGIKRLVQYGVAAAGFIGTAFGSICTILAERILGGRP